MAVLPQKKAARGWPQKPAGHSLNMEGSNLALDGNAGDAMTDLPRSGGRSSSTRSDPCRGSLIGVASRTMLNSPKSVERVVTDMSEIKSAPGGDSAKVCLSIRN